jgi:hypothetical protein
MSQVLEDRLPLPETKPEYTKWNPFPDKQVLDKGGIISQEDEGDFENLDTL